MAYAQSRTEVGDIHLEMILVQEDGPRLLSNLAAGLKKPGSAVVGVGTVDCHVVFHDCQTPDLVAQFGRES
jgi:hypothetical protein